VATAVNVEEARNFYYSVAAFEEIHGNLLDAEYLRLAFFTALDQHVAERNEL